MAYLDVDNEDINMLIAKMSQVGGQKRRRKTKKKGRKRRCKTRQR